MRLLLTGSVWLLLLRRAGVLCLWGGAPSSRAKERRDEGGKKTRTYGEENRICPLLIAAGQGYVSTRNIERVRGNCKGNFWSICGVALGARGGCTKGKSWLRFTGGALETSGRKARVGFWAKTQRA